MPVILAHKDWSAWLGTAAERNALLRPFPAERMQAWSIGKTVGNVRNDGPELIERIA
jgi:putative SOS response-associated peptidase YedK